MNTFSATEILTYILQDFSYGIISYVFLWFIFKIMRK